MRDSSIPLQIPLFKNDVVSVMIGDVPYLTQASMARDEIEKPTTIAYKLSLL